MTTIKIRSLVLVISGTTALLFCLSTGSAHATNPAPPEDPFEGSGNRYDLERNYVSEISAARAYIDTVVKKKHHYRYHKRGKKYTPPPVLIDVRGADEHTAGHPKYALSRPFPRTYRGPCNVRYPDGNCNTAESDPVFTTVEVTEEEFVNSVLSKIHNKNTPIYTLCRTGFRSVLAANLLTEAGYTNVRNIWEGFVGQHKVDFDGNFPLDLNNDGDLTDEDKDGWRYYQELPYETRLRHWKLNPMLRGYYNLD